LREGQITQEQYAQSMRRNTYPGTFFNLKAVLGVD